MDRRIIAMAAGFAAMVLAGAHPASAGQCEAACDKAFNTCNGTNPDTSACLPKWGQCKRACTAPASTPPKPAPAPQMTRVAQTKPK